MDRCSRSPLAAAALLVAVSMLFLPASSSAAGLTPELRAELTESPLLTHALIEALEQQERVTARVYFLPPAPEAREGKRRGNRNREDVSPVVVELAEMMLPGSTLGLLHFKSLDALQGSVDAHVVRMLLRNPNVVSMDLETDPPKPRPAPAMKVLCSATSTRACVESNRFSLEVANSGGFVPVATSSASSAVFYFSSSSNWEVVAKVLNGCGVNNKYWIFGAGATSLAYSLHVKDWVTLATASYNGAALCPIIDTGGIVGWPC
jgi:hypothetical protein